MIFYLNIVKSNVISTPTNRSKLVGREVKRTERLIGIAEKAEIISHGSVLDTRALHTPTGHFLIEAENVAHEMQYNGAYLNELQLTREQLVRDEIVLDISVVVLEQIDADERVDGRGCKREHCALPIWLAKAALARYEPVELKQRLLELFNKRVRIQRAQKTLELERELERLLLADIRGGGALQTAVSVRTGFGQLRPHSTQSFQVIRNLLHFDLKLHVVAVTNFVVLYLSEFELILEFVRCYV